MRVTLVELDADHPGFRDPEYRQRRDHIAWLAAAARERGEPCRIEYMPTETGTWTVAFDVLTTLYPTHACREHAAGLALLGFSRDAIPHRVGRGGTRKRCANEAHVPHLPRPYRFTVQHDLLLQNGQLHASDTQRLLSLRKLSQALNGTVKIGASDWALVQPHPTPSQPRSHCGGAFA